MKKILGIALLTSLIIGCKEEPPFINYEQSSKLLDTTYVEATVPTPQQKAMLLEDVSGVRCVNCPDAAIIANGIINAFPGRVYTTVMHPLGLLPTLVDPITKQGHVSKYDFRTEKARIILESRLGVPNSLPMGAINRRLFADSDGRRLIGRQNWFVKSQEELQTSTPVNIELKSELDESAGEGVVTVTLKYTQAITDAHYLSIFMVEDSLIDVQEYQDKQTGNVGYNNEYVHMHVFRDAITAATGDLITNATTELTPGRVYVKQYRYKLKVSEKINVVAKHAKLIAFVHKDNVGIDIIHANETHVKAH